MTRVRWTTNAADDLTRIVERIRKDNPDAARHVAQTIFNGLPRCAHFRTVDVLGWLRTQESLSLLSGPTSPYMK